VIEGARKENEKRKKPIIAYLMSGGYPCTCYFESIAEAEREFGSRHIVDVLKGKRKHVKGWTFEYVEGVMPNGD
jgi:hypothetical protein